MGFREGSRFGRQTVLYGFQNLSVETAQSGFDGREQAIVVRRVWGGRERYGMGRTGAILLRWVAYTVKSRFSR